MTLNGDGTAKCDRCGVLLPGFGVINGLVCTHLVNGTIEDLIFCYINGCRTVVLGNLIVAAPWPMNRTTPDDPAVRCNEDGRYLPSRSVDTAMLLAELAPDGDGVRYLQLCYEGGSRDRFLTNAGRTP